MKSIISRDNPSFKQLRKLVESARERRKSGQTVLDGVHLIESCLAAGMMPRMLVVSAGALDNAEIAALLDSLRGVQQLMLPPSLFAEISPVETPTGILAVIDVPRLHVPARPGFALLLQDLQDPGNLGSLLRSAAAAGVQVAWLSPGCADAWHPRVLRAGMGAHFVLPIVERVDLAATVAGFHGMTLAACLQGEPLYDIDLKGPVAFMIGNEGTGLGQSLVDAASRRFTIPMPGAVESLNAAAAAAICLFERVRQTR
ncbi:23S rRNA (uridine(2479)-2'-O)-methyltransferase [mine drainage metagenome]|uniref:23S rRNA (Uridine(2479)-2'-O)-methyltransferase n=1 Tax=mine drainage metagenome TaxID=410659 RepID=A0A1J5QTK0_9ZZZZ